MKDKLKIAVRKCLALLKQNDGILFECEIEQVSHYDARKLHEVCINHRLANHFQDQVLPILPNLGVTEEMFVDIEFNREGGNYKMLEVDGRDRLVRPDIIIHNRKSDHHRKNFLVVECKHEKSLSEEINQDKNKIRTFLNDKRYGYSFGLQVIYGKRGIKGALFFRGNTGIKEEEIVCV